MIFLEACVDKIEDALRAEKHGASQLEWCKSLEYDGLTPDLEETKLLLSKIKIPTKVMVRCRPGDFIYSDEEVFLMEEQCKQLIVFPGVQGIVFGATTGDGKLDIEAISRIVKLSKGKPVTIHKAIDTCTDILAEVHALNKVEGVKFILTSGGGQNAWEGREKLAAMQKIFSGHIIAAGKINRENLTTLHQEIAFQYYHGKQITG